MPKETFIMTNSQYKQGFEVSEYNGKFSLCSSNEGKDGKIWFKWVFPQNKDKEPIDKAIPMKVELGSRENAIARLKKAIEFVETYEDLVGGDGDDGHDDDIPF